jgi:transcriptional regulator with XRE-family HTH domain
MRGMVVDSKKIQAGFGQRLRALRKQRAFSQESLALACGLDRTYIGGVERGERNISLINIHRIAEALGVPASELLKVSARQARKKQ